MSRTTHDADDLFDWLCAQTDAHEDVAVDATQIGEELGLSEGELWEEVRALELQGLAENRTDGERARVSLTGWGVEQCRKRQRGRAQPGGRRHW